MPRFAILTGIRHGEKAPVVISDATTPFPEQKAAFKTFARVREHEEFSEVQLWTSDSGITAKHRLKVPKDDADAKAKADADAKAKADADAKAKADADAKAKAEADAKAKEAEEGEDSPSGRRRR